MSLFTCNPCILGRASQTMNFSSLIEPTFCWILCWGSTAITWSRRWWTWIWWSVHINSKDCCISWLLGRCYFTWNLKSLMVMHVKLKTHGVAIQQSLGSIYDLLVINGCNFWERWKLTFSSMITVNRKQIHFINMCYGNLWLSISYVTCFC